MRFALMPLLLLMGIFFINACSQPTPTFTPQPTPTFTPQPTPTPISRQATFKVDAGQTYEVSIDVEEGSEISYRFTSDLDVNFMIVDPYDALLRQISRVESANGSIVARDKGRHRLIFDNSFSIFASKTIDLNYIVRPPS